MHPRIVVPDLVVLLTLAVAMLCACGGSDEAELPDAGPDASLADGGGTVDVDPGCTNSCDNEGATSCGSARTVVTCSDYNGDGCLEPGNPTPCQGALFCVEGECVDTNTPPTAGDLQLSTPEDTPLSIELPGQDEQSAQLLFAITSGPSSGSLTGRLPALTYTPAADFHGEDVIEYTVSDRNASPVAGRVVVTVTPVNDAPVVEAATFAGDEDLAVEGQLVGVDVDGDELTFAVVTPPVAGDLVVNADGRFTYTPETNFSGEVSFSWKANDGSADSTPAIGTVTLNPVNDRPVAQEGVLDVRQDFDANLILQGEDAEGAALTFRVTTPPENGTLTGEPPALTYVPNRGVAGPDRFLFVVNDGELDSEPAQIVVRIQENTAAPVLEAADQTLDEDTQITFAVAVTDDDTPTSLLSVELARAPSHGTLTRLGDGRWNYAPQANFNGVDTAALRASDGQLTSSDVPVQFQVRPVNDAPTAAPIVLSGDEDQPVPFIALADDLDGDVLTWTVSTPPSTGTLTGDGPEFSYEPEPDESGDVVFALSVSDGTGAAVNVPVSVTILPVNDPPFAADSTAQTDEDTAAAGQVSAQDIDGDSLVYLLVEGPAQGDVTLNDDGSWSYLPSTNFAGVDSFSWRADDGDAFSDAYTVSITVNPVNDAPVVFTQSVNTPEDNVVDISLTVFDPDGDPVEIAQITAPIHGSAFEIDTLKVRYTPDENWNGEDTFLVTVTDTLLLSQPEQITVQVISVNDAPRIEGFSRSAYQFDQLTGFFQVTDVEGDAVHFRTLTTASGGSWSLSQDGTWGYIADSVGTELIEVLAKETGAPGSFACSETESVPSDWYCDGEVDCSNGRDECADEASCAVAATEPVAPCTAPTANRLSSNTATATFVIDALPAPVALDDTLPFLGNTPILYPPGTLTSNDLHILNRAFTAVAATVETANGGSAEVFADGSFRFTPAAGFRGEDSFQYSIALTTGETDTADVTLQMDRMYQYVDNRATETGNGTLLQPWATLNEAALLGAEGDILFVFAAEGPYIDTQAVLQPGQSVQGEPVGVTLTLPSEAALTIVPAGQTPPVLVPTVASGGDSIGARGGTFPPTGTPAVEVAEDCEIRSIACEADGSSACFSGIAVSNVRIVDVSTVGGQQPILLTELLGDVQLERISIQNASSNAMLLTVSPDSELLAEPPRISVRDLVVSVTQGSPTAFLPNGIALSLAPQSNSVVQFSDIDISGVEVGIDVNASASSRAVVDLADVTMQNLLYEGLQVYADELSDLSLSLVTDDLDDDDHACRLLGLPRAGTIVSASSLTSIRIEGCSILDAGLTATFGFAVFTISGSGEFQILDTSMQTVAGDAVVVSPAGVEAQIVTLDVDLNGISGNALSIVTDPAFGPQIVQVLPSSWTNLANIGVYVRANDNELPLSPISAPNLALLIQGVEMTAESGSSAPAIQFDLLGPSPVNVCAAITGNTLSSISGGVELTGDLLVEGTETTAEQSLTLANTFLSPLESSFIGFDGVVAPGTCPRP
jgi:VCBS repeat-containing protein